MPFPWKLNLIYTPVICGRNYFLNAVGAVAADVSPLIMKEFEPTYIGCYQGDFSSQMEQLPSQLQSESSQDESWRRRLENGRRKVDLPRRKPEVERRNLNNKRRRSEIARRKAIFTVAK